MDHRIAKGCFISFEGPERVGKSTQISLLKTWLEERGQSVMLVREPGGTPVGERIRSMVLDPAMDPLPLTDVLLFAAARSELVARVIRPALEEGRVVLADRYVDSSLAYQTYGAGVPREVVQGINQWATGGLEPDMTVLLLGPSYAEAAHDRIELRGEAFHQRVRAGYSQLADEFSRIKIVWADDVPTAIQRRIQELVRPYLAP